MKRGTSACAQPPELAVGRRVVAEVGRDHDGALELCPERRGRHPQRKAAAGGMTEQGQRHVRPRLADLAEEIGHVILELA
jgi:hypothetical protein